VTFNLRLSFLLVLSFAAIVLLPFWGAETILFSELGNPQSLSYRILFELRVPRIVLLFIVGGSLAMLGGTYQVLFHNPLAEPYILGVSSAVTLGAVLSEVVLHLNPHTLGGMVFPIAGALIVTALLLILSFSKFGREPERVVLFGMGLNFLLSSALFLILSYYSQQMGVGSMRWLFGQIPWVTAPEAATFSLVALPFIVGILLLSRQLDALSLGDTVARTLGVSPLVSRNIILVTTSIFIAVLVSLTGSIGFLGLVVPHACRLLFRPSSTRLLLSFSFLLGAIFLAVADVSSRTLLPPFEFPPGILTTIIGAPPFLYLLWKR
jgi:iron complex transport system permease protein